VTCVSAANPSSDCTASAADVSKEPARAVELLRAPELICRAWDENMNTQPDTLTWNLMCASPSVIGIVNKSQSTYVADCSWYIGA
jgi:hypothetical protein